MNDDDLNKMSHNDKPRDTFACTCTLAFHTPPIEDQTKVSLQLIFNGWRVPIQMMHKIMNDRMLTVDHNRCSTQ